MMMKKVVSVSWLSRHLDTVRVIDASWSLPPFAYADGTSALAAFVNGPRIPTAKFWDLDQSSDDSAAPGVPHNLPTKAQFEQAANECDLNPNSRVVVYDQFGIFSSPRLYWTLKRYGFDNVAVLDGGLPAWLDAGYETSREIAEIATKSSDGESFVVNQKYEQWRLEDVRSWLSADPQQRPRLLDARSKARFDGSVPDPRGLRSGHVPGSSSVPFTELLQPNEKYVADESLPGGVWRGATFKSEDELRKLLLPRFNRTTEDASRREEKIGLTCGSGMTAAVLALGLDIIDAADTISLYDGSWTEYAQTADMPVLGAAAQTEQR